MILKLSMFGLILWKKNLKKCRGVKKCNDGIYRIEKEKQTENLRASVGFKEYYIMLTKKQSVLKSVMDAFDGENMQTQYSVLGYKIDLYFHDYKHAIEVEEKSRKDRSIDHEIKRQKGLEKELNCEFIRINPDEKDFNIFKTLNEIHREIKKFTKESANKSLIDELSKKLLKLKFKSNNSIN